MASIVFMGTPRFAVPSLEALLRAGHEVALVVTQPDRPAGRGKQLQPPPVKQIAQAHGLRVLQSERLRKDPEAVALLAELRPDLACVVAFGQILPPEILAIPAHGCLNVHGSLLPAYRGAGPVQRALLNGDRQTGVTTMLMDAGMDTGPMLLAEPILIAPEDDAGSLAARMADKGADLLVQTIAGWLEGNIEARPQPEQGVSMAPMLRKSDGILDWSQSAQALFNRVRGTTPWPGAQTTLEGLPLKIQQTALGPTISQGPVGSILEVSQDGWLIQTSQGTLWLKGIQLPGKRPQTAHDVAKGLRTVTRGAILGGAGSGY